MSAAGYALFQQLLVVAGIVCAGAGLVFILADRGAAPEQNRLCRWTRELWQTLLQTPWRRLPIWLNGAVTAQSENFIEFWFGGSERNAIAGGLFVFTVVIAIPIAAAINALRGSSPFLISVIGGLALVVALLALLAEIRAGRSLRALLAVIFFAGAFLFVPAYVFVSFTGRIIHIPVGHAAIGSVIIVPLLYLACHSAAIAAQVVLRSGFVGRAGWAVAPLSAYLAMVPVAYLLSFIAILRGHLLVPTATIPLDGATLGVSTAMIALGLAVTIRMFATGRLVLAWLGSFAAVAIVAALQSYLLLRITSDGPAAAEIVNLLLGYAASGNQILLGPRFWLTHAPFVLLVVALFLGIAAALAKLFGTALAAAGVGIPQHSFAVSGGYLLLAGALLLGGGWAVG